MSWRFGNNVFDQVIERVTSEMIPAGQKDIGLFLEICDRIRANEIPAKEAMRSLKKRVSNKNPNVQLLALKLVDTCVKNGGSLFVAEIASREFMDTLVGIVSNGSTNAQVKSALLGHIASWAVAFKTKPNLSYVIDTYHTLKAQGYTFPVVAKASATMTDTQEAPEWIDSETCDRCRSLFTLRARKHYCRNCGKTICNSCSKNTITLPRLGINKEVRVCNGCFRKVTETLPDVNQPAWSITDVSKEEAELERAIALSIAEAERNKELNSISSRGNLGRAPSPILNQRSAPEEVDDPDLAAAIAASLSDVDAPSSPLSSSKSSDSYSYSHYPKASDRREMKREPLSVSFAGDSSRQPPQSPAAGSALVLGQTEFEDINLFHRLVDNLEADATGQLSLSITTDLELKGLHESMILLHPKLVGEIEECVERHKNLMDMHAKLTGSVRTFERLFEERLLAQRQAALAQQQVSYNPYLAGPVNGYTQPGYAVQPSYGPPPPHQQQQYQQPPLQQHQTYAQPSQVAYQQQQQFQQLYTTSPPPQQYYQAPHQHQQYVPQQAPHQYAPHPSSYADAAAGYLSQQHQQPAYAAASPSTQQQHGHLETARA